MKKTVDNRVSGWYNNQRRQGRHTSFGGLAQLGERLHGMQEVSGSIPLFSTKKALYFVGSMVLFFLYRRRKRRELPTKGKATAFVDHRMSQP